MDAKMIAAYARFEDIVVFDTTFGTNNEKWDFSRRMVVKSPSSYLPTKILQWGFL
jgi:hypothetical protein